MGAEVQVQPQRLPVDRDRGRCRGALKQNEVQQNTSWIAYIIDNLIQAQMDT